MRVFESLDDVKSELDSKIAFLTSRIAVYEALPTSGPGSRDTTQKLALYRTERHAYHEARAMLDEIKPGVTAALDRILAEDTA